MRELLITTIFILLAATNISFAHGGHLGELAGHAHWVGVAAVLGAAAIAGILVKGSKKTDEQAADEDLSDADQDAGERA